MADNLYTQKTTDVQSTGKTSPADHTAASECRSGMMGCGMGHKGLKGLLLMAACCGAPVLLLLALPVLGSALGGLGASAVSTLAFLACPIGMALMMWMMMRAQRTGAPEPVQAQPVSLAQVASTAPAQPQETAVLQDIPDTGEARWTPPSLAQEDIDTPPRSVNGHQTARPTLAVNGHQTAVPTPADSRTQAATPPQA
jgi:hypothetical protein